MHYVQKRKLTCLFVIAALTAHGLAVGSKASAQEPQTRQQPDLDYSKIPDRIPGATYTPRSAQRQAVEDEFHSRLLGEQPPEPEGFYQGLDREGWRKLLKHEAPALRLSALVGLRTLRSRAADDTPWEPLPEIVELLDDPDPRVRYGCLQLGLMLGAPREAFLSKAMEFLNDPQPLFRLEAISLARGHPEDCQAAIGTLIELLNDTTALHESDLHGQRFQSPTVRESAIRALGRFGPAAREAKPQLMAALREPKREVVIAALDSLVKVAGTEEDVLEFLVTQLQSDEAPWNELALHHLAGLGLAASPALPFLLSLPDERLYMLNSEPAKVPPSTMPLVAMAKIGPNDPRVFEKLKSYYSENRSSRRAAALEATTHLPAEVAANLWMEALSDPDNEIVWVAKNALAPLGGDLVPRYLEIAAAIETDSGRASLLMWIREFGDLPESCLPQLQAMLEEALQRGGDIKSEGTLVLAHMLSDADLELILKHTDARVRELGMWFAFDPENDDENARPRQEEFLLTSIKDPYAPLRVRAAGALIERFPERMGLALPVIMESRVSLVEEERRLRQQLEAATDFQAENAIRSAMDQLAYLRTNTLWRPAEMLTTLGPYEPKLIDVVLNDVIARRSNNDRFTVYEYDTEAYPDFAVDKIARMGELAVEATMERLKSQDSASRFTAAQIISQMPEPPEGAILYLLDMLDAPGFSDRLTSHDRRLAGTAAIALANFEELDDGVVEALIEKLTEDRNEYVVPILQSRGAVVVSRLRPFLFESRVLDRDLLRLMLGMLESAGAAANEAIPELLAIAKRQPGQAFWIASTILEIDPDNAEAPQLRNLRGERYSAILERSAEEEREEEEVPLLETDVAALLGEVSEYLSKAENPDAGPDSSFNDRQAARVEARRHVGRRIERLARLPAHLVEPHLTAEALSALGKVIRANESTFDSRVVRSAAFVASWAGKRAQPQFADFMANLGNQYDGGGAAARFFLSVNPTAAADQLVKMVQDGPFSISAAGILGDLASFAPDNAPQVLTEYAVAESAKDNAGHYSNGATAAVSSLSAWGPEVIAFQDQLLALLENDELHDRATTAIGNLGRPAVPQLAMALLQGNADVRQRAAWILRGQLSPFAAEARRIVGELDASARQKQQAIELLSPFWKSMQ